MIRFLKWMLSGIFLAIASVWCLIAGSGNTVFAVLGFYILPLVALACFIGALCEPTENPSVPTDEEDKE